MLTHRCGCTDLTAIPWPSSGKPPGALLSVLPGTEIPKSTHLQKSLHPFISFLCNLLATILPVVSVRNVGEGFHSSEWAVKIRAVAEAVTLSPICM